MKKEESYTGENEKWLQFNKRIVIRRNEDDPNSPAYLIRRTLISFGKFFSMKYHQILQSDDECSHDHPWGFVTLILKGGYYEWTPISQKENGTVLDKRYNVHINQYEVKRWHGAGTVLYRSAEWCHRLQLREELGFDQKKYVATLTPIPAHTFVLTFRVVRDWGFFTTKGWIFWRNYNKQRDC